MSLLSGRKAYLPLVKGVEYHAVMTSYEEYVANADVATDKRTGFIAFKLQLVEDGRVITDTRSTPIGTDIMSRQILEQTGMPNAMGQEELFNECIKNKLPLKLWVTTNETDGETYTNYTYLKPLEPKKAQPVDAEDFK